MPRPKWWKPGMMVKLKAEGADRAAHRLIFSGSLMIVCQRNGQPVAAQHRPRVTCIEAGCKASAAQPLEEHPVMSS